MLSNILQKITVHEYAQFLDSEELKLLKRRIRPAMQLLIDREDLFTMEKVSALQFYGAAELEYFIRYAMDQRRKMALLWLIKEKKERYGFSDPVLEL